jgi:hypothetical protein
MLHILERERRRAREL